LSGGVACDGVLLGEPFVVGKDDGGFVVGGGHGSHGWTLEGWVWCVRCMSDVGDGRSGLLDGEGIIFIAFDVEEKKG
jgi:hypothetical protein